MISESRKDPGMYTLDLSNSIFINSALSQTNLTKANLSQIHAAYFTFEHTRFESSNLTGAYFNDCSAKGCDFSGTELNEVISINMDFEAANFLGAHFDTQCAFEGCSFKQANFCDTVLSMECFEGQSPASFEGVDFSNAKIYASDEGLAREKLSRASIAEAKFHSNLAPDDRT